MTRERVVIGMEDVHFNILHGEYVLNGDLVGFVLNVNDRIIGKNDGTTRQFRMGLVAFVVIWAGCRQVLMSFCIKCLEEWENGRTFAASKPINNCSVRH